MRVLVCGSRRWVDREALRRELAALPEGSLIIHGDNGYDARGRPLWGEPDELAARGADKLAGALAAELGFEVLRFSPDWHLHGRKAGPIRNTQLLAEGQPELVIACASDLSRSSGVADLVRKADRAGVPVRRLTGGEVRSTAGPSATGCLDL